MAQPTTNSPVRAYVALTGVAAALSLAGCASGGPAGPVGQDGATGADGAGGADSEGPYADGTYTADGSYATPESVETISVTVTLEDDVITDVEVTGDPQAGESQRYQSEFIGGIADEVVGRDIDEISVSRVAGSSLTSGGFNDAIAQIRADAAES